MAYKSFRTLTPRNQSSLVTQLHKLINYYGEIFCPRERSYIKSLTQHEDTIYWLEDDIKKIIAVAIVDPNYTVSTSYSDVAILGHTISKRPGQMDRILNHIWSDYEDKTLAIVCRKSLSSAFDSEELQLIEFTPLELSQYWPELANHQTNYFNLTEEKFVNGLNRKDYCIYVNFSESSLNKIKEESGELYSFIESKRKQGSEA